MRWWESPFVLAFSGALAVHLAIVVMVDAVVIYNPPEPPEVAPRVELVDVEIPRPPPPKPDPPPSQPKPPEPVPAPAPIPAPPQRVASREPHPSEPPHAETPPPANPPVDDSAGGHEQTFNLPEDTNRDGFGKQGSRTDDRIGPRGHGTGTGSGSGSGSAEVEAPRPVSVATIKTAAKPKGDYAYFDDAKRYPEEAKQQGIEGAIKVQLIVDETGKIKKTRLLTRLGHGLDELALQHAHQLEFEPARDTDDRPVTSVVVWTFHMTLPK